jgi:hypothetical protein
MPKNKVGSNNLGCSRGITFIKDREGPSLYVQIGCVKLPLGASLQTDSSFQEGLRLKAL